MPERRVKLSQTEKDDLLYLMIDGTEAPSSRSKRKAKYKRRKCTVEPVFGIIKNVLGFNRFSLRGISNVKTEWLLVTLAYNCKRLYNLRAA